ncbi:putative sortase (Surface protein transpeptidase) [metagenome]|uniref:Putative sortase (Surface protein transpeptidase) n=1 Tax=metagenome TaxID=256318 RepID=A0A2P2CGQ2_9ZZZZ
MAGRLRVLLAAAAVAATAACAAEEPRRGAPGERRTTSASLQPTTSPTPGPTTDPAPSATPAPEPERPEPRRSHVSIPAIGLRDFPVVRYPGSPDDAPGTVIQDAGEMASPRGPRGGTGPGQVGNFIVTGHRLTGPAPLRYSPSLRRGDRILVRSGDTVFVYEVRRTRWTSFREPASLRAQQAEVPGRPGREATRAMITLSTCATLEDHAAGNYWHDEFDNPEHRIDKIGILVATRPA